MSGQDATGRPEDLSLYEHEESVIREAEQMLAKLDEVSSGVRTLASAYRSGYRETVRLVRISDRMQLDLHEANRALLTQAADLKRLNAALVDEIQERKRLEEELRRIASIDELTGTFTRRHLLELGEHEMRRLRRHQHPMAILLMDLDHFKLVNDTHGHAAGDEVLRRFGGLLQRCVREGDVAGRFGGEEFLAILPETELATALAIAERLRAELSVQRVDWKGQALAVTISIGVAEIAGDELLERAIARADRALYRAKRAGRNRVVALTREADSASTEGGA